MPSTRGQKTKRAEEGLPESPAQALPETNPRQKKAPKPKASAATKTKTSAATKPKASAATKHKASTATKRLPPKKPSETASTAKRVHEEAMAHEEAVTHEEAVAHEEAMATETQHVPETANTNDDDSASMDPEEPKRMPSPILPPNTPFKSNTETRELEEPKRMASSVLTPNTPSKSNTKKRLSWNPSARPALPAVTKQGDRQAVVMLWLNANEEDISNVIPMHAPTVSVTVPMGNLQQLLKNYARQYGNNDTKLTKSTGTQRTPTTGSKRKATDDLESNQPKRIVRFAETPVVETHKRRVVGWDTPLYTAEGKLDLTLPRTPIYADEQLVATTTPVVQNEHRESQTASDVQTIVQATNVDAAPAQIPETPSRGSWNLSTLFNTASKLVPGLGRRTQPSTPTIQRPLTHVTSIVSTPDVLRPHHPRTEPRLNTRTVTPQTAPNTSRAAPPAYVPLVHPRRRVKPQQKAESHKISKTQATSARENRRTQRLHEQAEAVMTEHQDREAELSRIEEGKRVLEEEKRVLEDRERSISNRIEEEKRILEDRERSIRTQITREKSEAQQKAIEDWYDEKQANPGLKRKRPKSPDEIVAPKGASFGIDERFLYDYSSDSEKGDAEEDQHNQTSPISTPSKHARKMPRLSNERPPMSTSQNHKEVMGEKNKAQPYSGSFFGEEAAKHQQGLNVFGEVSTSQEAAQKASDFKQSAAPVAKALKTPKSPPRMADGRVITNYSGRFCVPDDDSDEEDSILSDNPSPSVNKDINSAPAPANSKTSQQSGDHTAGPVSPSEVAVEAPSSTQQSFTTAEKGKAPAWSQPPPAAPSPSHATLPSFPTADSESLVAARAKALKHAPKKPSSLRESSRINSSPLAPTGATADQPDTSAMPSDALVIHSDDPTEASSSTLWSSREEVIDRMWQDIMNKPNAKMQEVLEVLREKSPNSQSKPPSQDPKQSDSPDNTAEDPETLAAVELVKTLAKPHSSALKNPCKDQTPVHNYLGFPGPVPKWMVNFVEAFWTEGQQKAVDLTEDFAAFNQEHPDEFEDIPEILEGCFPQDTIDILAGFEMAGYYEFEAARAKAAAAEAATA